MSKLTTDHLWFHWLCSSSEETKRLCLAAQNGDEAARAAVAAMPADRSRLLSVAEAEGRRIGWPGPRGAAFPVDAAGRLYDDRCLNHERIDPATCPICHGTHVRPVDMFFG